MVPDHRFNELKPKSGRARWNRFGIQNPLISLEMVSFYAGIAQPQLCAR
jgi:hypothetical protein